MVGIACIPKGTLVDVERVGVVVGPFPLPPYGARVWRGQGSGVLKVRE